MSLDEAHEVYRESYTKHTNRLCEETPRWDYWFSSGPYHGEADIERRHRLGLEQVTRYVHYYTVTAPQEVVWTTPAGDPAIELGFEINLDGVPVRGYLDQVTTCPARPTPWPRDLKTGNLPGDAFQLAVYAIALLLNYGISVTIGDYWMGRSGKPTLPYALTEWTVERVTEEFHQMDAAVRAGRFEPKPEPAKCRFCPVQASCAYAAA
ncbi:hypothetical protein GCM10012275_15320 [Longimycelium tulufanense]|uniref:PD-(D/E)XK endonuclease-like domain-containing protein n=2 Tax=Longimycelium tulufanense TaxID=907463 RepID=A0A8J3C6Z4_9PSEU|nr:hypothetical protein GCM10012275_15320 [Longimycelium tulufanense]